MHFRASSVECQECIGRDGTTRLHPQLVHSVAPLAIHNRWGRRCRPVVVDGGALADELRRRRLGRRGLANRVADAPGTTWLPGAGDLRSVSAELLVLAALALTRSTV